MFTFFAVMLAITYVPSLLIAYYYGFQKCNKQLENQRERYERLTDEDVERINHWHETYIYHVGSYPSNWEVVRKLKRKL